MSDAAHPHSLTDAFAPDALRAVHDVIRLRRDVRNFRPDPVPDALLRRLLDAAHHAGSVGNMQPWDFVVVRSAEQKARIYALFREANTRAAARFGDDRAAAYLALKLQGVLDAPVGLCVTCDTTRGGPHVLGRDSVPEMDRYSTCLAIQNLWLAARAEGLGVGWVSIVDHDALATVMELPAGVVPIAYLCVGVPVEFAPKPMLAEVGWRERLPLDALVHHERWGVRSERGAEAWTTRDPITAATRESQPNAVETVSLEALVAAVRPADLDGARVARIDARLDALAKPVGSLGHLERVCRQLAAVQDVDWPRTDRRRVLIFAGDHGVARDESVSAYRPGVTAQLCYTMIAGGATLNALVRPWGGRPEVVDVGVDHDFGGAPGLVHAKVRRGTRNLAVESALTREEVLEAIAAGARAVRSAPADVLLLGEIGIGNSTAAAALAALLLGLDADAATGLGTGVQGPAAARKRAVVSRALMRARAEGLGAPTADPIMQLAAVGGLEIAALTGAMLAGAARRTVLLLDGYIVGTAALVAMRLAPAVREYCIASHRSAEPGHAAVLEALGLAPLLALELRLGEASGAALALPLLESACAVLRDVRTFEEAGIDVPLDPRAFA